MLPTAAAAPPLTSGVALKAVFVADPIVASSTKLSSIIGRSPKGENCGTTLPPPTSLPATTAAAFPAVAAPAAASNGGDALLPRGSELGVADGLERGPSRPTLRCACRMSVPIRLPRDAIVNSHSAALTVVVACCISKLKARTAAGVDSTASDTRDDPTPVWRWRVHSRDMGPGKYASSFDQP